MTEGFVAHLLRLPLRSPLRLRRAPMLPGLLLLSLLLAFPARGMDEAGDPPKPARLAPSTANAASSAASGDSAATGPALNPEDTAFLKGLEQQLEASLEDKMQLALERDELAARIEEMERRTQQRRLLIARRLRALNGLRRFQWGEWLMNSDLNDLERQLRILRNLNQRDYRLFREYHAALKLLEAARKNLQETEDLIENNVSRLQTKENEFHELEKIRIESLQRSKTQSLLVYKGQLPRPLEGRPQQEFGSVRDKVNRYYLLNRGELYAAKPAAAVRAVGPGKVIFRDELPRWRETLVVQHDDNYYSVYAGVTKSRKKIGDRVETGETIAQAAGEELYFELRHFDQPINPKSWYRE